jgi:dTDP-4-amino-4,6-dideoxygalactose transaminase
MKQYICDLAVFGGCPAFSRSLHVGRPNSGRIDCLRERIDDILERRWLTNDGPYVKEFERQLAQMIGVAHCIAVCNGTVALEIAIKACGLTGEVIVPSFTFVATAHALQWLGVTPVFCDIDPLTHNLDPASVERMINPRTTGIIGVHLWGRPCCVERLSAVAGHHGLTLLFDAAHAFGCSYKGTMIGNFGKAEVLSFHATKFINSFEGGAVATNDDGLAREVRSMRNFGFVDYDQVMSVGTNGKMNEVSAAMGLTSIESLNEFIEVNCRNYKHYQDHLAGIPGVNLMIYDESERHNHQYIILEMDENVTRITRDQLQHVLWRENVFARRYFYPGCHRMEPYRSLFPRAGLFLPHTERLAEKVLALPTGTSIGPEDIREICQIIRFVVAHGQEAGERLSSNGPLKFTAQP